MGKKQKSLVPAERIEQSILLIRGHRVLLDSDLSSLYGVETKRLVEAVKRNKERFPDDFMFQLNEKEFDNLKSQFATSSSWGGRRYAPYVFTEQGVAMLSSVLRSPRAVAVPVHHARRSDSIHRNRIMADRWMCQRNNKLSHGRWADAANKEEPCFTGEFFWVLC